jgi:hypothetical protein
MPRTKSSGTRCHTTEALDRSALTPDTMSAVGKARLVRVSIVERSTQGVVQELDPTLSGIRYDEVSVILVQPNRVP